jgi:hypothetical protein
LALRRILKLGMLKLISFKFLSISPKISPPD